MAERAVIRAGLFDMDGVVADTQEAVTTFWQDVAASDALSGVEAAMTAGSTCVGVTTPMLGQALLSAGASVVVPDLQAITIECSAGRCSLLAAERAFDLVTSYDDFVRRPDARAPL